ncbi:hypothetical protein EDD52_1314 [Primorskyibacter sedentarius]|uniref:DUF3800 domain-containing protein n=1 Tax=Primorskyibacter sedentarius TaxID=745311 RepID=A0A4R3IV43_9RHOB|nr:hypothetical protein [Primorskyibacter sedentarius]TCS55252.1 hypothetical protein EDD52_1314 [Primorskyibacter sedentarius]
MAYLFLDDSKHHRSGFSLAAFAICDVDPTEEMGVLFREYGFDPGTFEFKSSATMKDDNDLQALRDSLKHFIARNCKMALCVVDSAEDTRKLGPASLTLLRSALKHPLLEGRQHEVFFDEGLFKHKSAAEALVAGDPELAGCIFHFEQDSKAVMGIQLADIMAHTCSIMLLEALGDISKKVIVNAPGDSVYDGLEVELGFEMWAGIRYAFLSQNKPNPKHDFDLANVDVYPWGLFIDESVNERVAPVVMERFGENYLGCIH